MSLPSSFTDGLGVRFPRVSGDEPNPPTHQGQAGGF